jgi:hypothetical protein
MMPIIGEHRAFSMLAYVWRRTRDAETGAALADCRSPMVSGWLQSAFHGETIVCWRFNIERQIDIESDRGIRNLLDDFGYDLRRELLG